MRVFTGVLKINRAESMAYKNNHLNSAHLIIRGNLGNTAHARFSRKNEMEIGLQPRIGVPSSDFTFILKNCKNAHAHD